MIRKLEQYLKLLEREITMSAYLDGWQIRWIREKIEETKKEIGCLKK